MVDDIQKLRPELLKKSPAELERMATEIAMAQAYQAREAEVAAKEQLAADANRHIDAVVAGVKWLYDNAMLPEQITTAFSTAGGAFVPARKLSNVTAESLVSSTLTQRAPRDPNAPKRHRRTKVEIEAARAAGEVIRRR